MIYEIHIAADTFLDNFSNRFRNMQICYTSAVDIGGAEPVYLDRVDFGQPRMEGALEIVQPVLIRWVTMRALKAAAGKEAAGTEYTCDIHTKCQIENGAFTIQLGDVVFNDAWPPNIATYFEKFVVKTGFKPPAPVSLPLEMIATMSGLPLDSVPIAGVNVTEGQSAMVIRIEYSTAPDMRAWAAFHQGKTTNRLKPGVAGNFCVFIDVASLMSKTEHDLRDNLGKEMSVNSVSCRWQPDANGGVIHTAADATLMDKCKDPLGIGAVDVDIDITAQTNLSLVRQNVLQMHSTFDWDADNWDVARCGALLSLDALIPGQIGNIILGPSMLAVSVAVTVGVLIAIGPIVANYPVKMDPQKDCVNGDKEQTCTMDLTVDGPSGPVKFSHSSGTNEGLFLFGAMAHERLVSRPVIDSFNLFPLAAKVQGNCNNAHIAGAGGVVIRYRPSENLMAMVPVEICKSEVLNHAPYQADVNPTSISVEYSLTPGQTPTQPCLFFSSPMPAPVFSISEHPRSGRPNCKSKCSCNCN